MHYIIIIILYSSLADRYIAIKNRGMPLKRKDACLRREKYMQIGPHFVCSSLVPWDWNWSSNDVRVLGYFTLAAHIACSLHETKVLAVSNLPKGCAAVVCTAKCPQRNVPSPSILSEQTPIGWKHGLNCEYESPQSLHKAFSALR